MNKYVDFWTKMRDQSLELYEFSVFVDSSFAKNTFRLYEYCDNRLLIAKIKAL